MAKATAKKKTKVDPFKTKKTRTQEAKVNDTLTPPPEIAEAIDQFRECQEQAKHYEGESTIHKDVIYNYCAEEYTKRLLNGQSKSFKVLGEETMVTYVAMDASSGLTDEDLEEIAERWGEEAAEDLVVRDFRSIRFDPEVLEANYEQVVGALQTLDPEVLENLFKPMLMKAAPDAANIAKRYSENADDLKDLLFQLKLKHYIR